MKLEIFNFGENDVRTMMVDGEPWFVAADLANILGYRDAPTMSRNLDGDEVATQIVCTNGGNRQVNVINESGLYSCILKSRRDEAKQFKKWVTSVVLPSLRKTGGYMVGEENAQSEEEVIMLAMQMLQRKIDAMKPKAEYHDQWMSSEGSFTMSQVAKRLGTTAVKLNKFLREEGVKWKNKDLPKAGYEGWFKLVDFTYATYDEKGSGVSTNCRVTPEGVKNITELYSKKAA